MSIFQPSNITPSTFAGIGNGVVDVNDPIVISWQVNGTSPLTGYTVEIYENDAASTPVDPFSMTVSPPFYGVDRFGNPVVFQAVQGSTWANFGLVNGKSYKMVITQRWGANNANSVVQISPSVFITRTTPTVAFDNFPSSVTDVSQSFSATYTQAEGDGINWSRWQLRRVDNNGNYETIDDTGEIATSNLNYSYDGFVNGYSYQLSLTVETQSGMQATTGFVDFSVSYELAENGQLPVQAVSDSSFLLRFFDLDGAASPANGYGNFVGESLALATNASVTWDSRQGEPLSIPTASSYQVVWRGNATAFAKQYTETSASDQLCAVCSSGNLIVTAGSNYLGYINTPIINLYQKTGEQIDLIQRITITQIDPSFSTNTQVNDVQFSPNGSTLLVGGGSSIAVFTMDGNGVVFKQHISPASSNARTVFNTVYALAFLDDQTFIAVGEFGAFRYIYNGNEWVFASIIDDRNSRSLAVSPSKEYFAIGYTANVTSMASVFSKSGAIINVITPSSSSYEYSCNCLEFFGDGNLAISGFYYDPSDSLNTFASLRSIYSISGTAITKVSDIPMPSGESAGTAIAFAYSNSQNIFAVSFNDGYVSVYQGIQSPTYLYRLSLPFSAQSLLFSYSPTEFFACGGNFSQGGVFYAYRFGSSSNFLELGTDGVEGNDNLFFQRNVTTIGLWGRLGSLSTLFPIDGEDVVLSLTSNSLDAWFFQNGEQVSHQTASLTYTQPEINSISLNGVSTTDYVWIKSSIDPFVITDPIQIDAATYFLADFSTQSLVAPGFPVASTSLSGTLFSVTNGVMKRLVSLTTDIANVKDFSAPSGESREYVLLYSTQTSNRYYYSSSVCARWNAYYLIEAAQDSQEPNVYHAVNVWKFGNNINAGSVSNNNSPTWQTNFTPYRLRQQSSRMGKSGTLQALLSNAKNQKYQDSAQLMDSLFSLSQTQNALFLKDMKGNLYMVQVSGPITQTINTKSYAQQVTVSIPWEEVGDASTVSVIQTSTDAGFEYGDSSVNI